MTRCQRSIVLLGVVTSLVLVLVGSTSVFAQRQWSFAADDGAGVSAFYDVDGGDVVVEFRNESTRYAHIEYQVSCEARRGRGGWRDDSQTSIESITVSPDRVAHARWTCSTSWTVGPAPHVEDVTVRLFQVTYEDRPGLNQP